MRWIALCLLLISLTACSSAAIEEATNEPLTAEPTTETLTTEPPTAIAEASITLEPTATATPDVINPTVERAEGIILAEWSPDSHWMAYWVAEPHTGETNPPEHAWLAFASPDGQQCEHPDLSVPQFWLQFPVIFWQTDQSIIVKAEAGYVQGTPCGEFMPVEPPTFPDPDVQPSPDGSITAHLTMTGEDQVENYTVTFTDTASGEVIDTVSWQGSIFFQRSGPHWLDNDHFVMGFSWDKGLLYYSVPDRRVGDIAADLLGEPSLCTADFQCGISAFVDDRTGIFHLLVSARVDDQAGSLLYHSETGETEIVRVSAWPIHAGSRLSGYSEDGKWLFGIAGPETPFGPEQPGEAYWLRPVDPSGSALRQFNRDHARAWGDVSLATGRAALWDLDGVYVYSFPEGDLLKTCTISGAEPQRAVWSPDASWIAVTGNLYPDVTTSVLAFCQP